MDSAAQSAPGTQQGTMANQTAKKGSHCDVRTSFLTPLGETMRDKQKKLNGKEITLVDKRIDFIKWAVVEKKVNVLVLPKHLTQLELDQALNLKLLILSPLMTDRLTMSKDVSVSISRNH